MTEETELAERNEAVRALGDIVTLWAHPDDESYLVGGLMSAAMTAGARVTCVTATMGDFASTELERRRIADRRHFELHEALTTLGVTDVVELGLADGRCDVIDSAGPVASLAAVIADSAPDTIVTFGPDGLTGHPDHRAVSAWTMEAAARAGSTARILHTAITREMLTEFADVNEPFDVYAAGFPWSCAAEQISVDLALGPKLLDLKVRALRAHSSQTEGIIAAIGEARYRQWIARETFVDAPVRQLFRRALSGSYSARS